MELIALPAELATLPHGMNAFAETRANPVRMFDHVPAHWARGGEVLTVQAAPFVGEYFTFQVGLFANGVNLTNVSVTISDLIPASTDTPQPTIPSTASSCFNLGGVDAHGEPFTKTYSVSAGSVGALWFGVDLPASTEVRGQYRGTVSVRSGDGKTAQNRTIAINLSITLPVNGLPIQDRGDGDIYNMSRLRWLNSRLGIDDAVVAPFSNLTVGPAADGGLTLGAVNKNVSIGGNGLPAQAVVTARKVRGGRNISVGFTVLETPLAFECWVAGSVMPMKVTKPARVVEQTPATVSWTAELTSTDGALVLNVIGSMDFDSYLEFSVTVTATRAVSLSDISTRLSLADAAGRMMCGMGVEGSYLQDLQWFWDKSMGNNRIWLGRADAGVYFYPRGDGPDWENPDYSKEYPTIPFIPSSWGGVTASTVNQTNVTGARVYANGTVATCSGPRMLAAGASVVFLFDVAFTPSKPLDLRRHWRSRYLQIGYGGVQYAPPDEVAAMGVTVATLHQGIGGLHNGTMVNPYINYPFVPDVVAFMENFTTQASALGMQVKFYDTIRELSNHAVELYALKALQGEVLTDADPFTSHNPGITGGWDGHGGGAYLHQHLVDHYLSCWQQKLPNGEVDAAICDLGTSRWFNYYLEGVAWSTREAPHIGGLYYDGINFDRRSFRRVRKVLDRAAAAAGHPTPLVDVHTGERGVKAPSAMLYLSHFPYADSAWNGEGFNWNGDPAYWLVDVSGFIHGIPCDRLGGTDAIKGMLFANYQRNGASAAAIWRLWDEVEIQDMTLVGWWEDDAPVVAVPAKADKRESVSAVIGAPRGLQKPGACNNSFGHTVGSYIYAKGGASGVIGFGYPGTCGTGKHSYPNLTVAQAQAVCCSIASCVGFSWARSRPVTEAGQGCFQINNDGVVKNPKYDGYERRGTPSPSPGLCNATNIKTTTFVGWGRSALVVVASWCPTPVNVTLAVDWSALGLDASNTVIIRPLVPGVQTVGGPWGPTEPITVSGDVNGGVMLLLQPK